MKKIDLLIISGPTAVGKTEISLKLAKRLNGEIISADSMQIYKYMDIGSAKITREEMQGVPHHLIDFIDPSEPYSAAQFKEDAKKLILHIHSNGKYPMLVGGTGLYIDSLISNFSFTEAEKDLGYREELETIAKQKGNEYVHDLLKEVDPESGDKLHPNNLKRVIRALEVYKITGKPFSQYVDEENQSELPYNLHYFVLNMDRAILYERINKRVDIMLEKGLIDEVVQLKKRGYSAGMQSMKGIGYKEILYYLDGLITLERAIEMIKQGSRNYAKRQLTWFRRDPRVNWIQKENYNSEDSIVDYIIANLKS